MKTHEILVAFLSQDRWLHDKLAPQWLSGCSTIVYPITVSEAAKTITIQLESGREPKSWMTKFKTKFGRYVESISFWKSDGSCPATITIHYNEH